LQHLRLHRDDALHIRGRLDATLVLAISCINVWNRLNVAVRQPVGAWQG
jgi:hypothetical protein